MKLEQFHPKLVQSVKFHEGLRLSAYRDTKGIWTIGYGHNLEASPPANKPASYDGYVISQAQADKWLAEDIGKAVAAAHASEEWPYMNTLARQHALIELIFNMGLGREPAEGKPGRGYLSFIRTRAAMRNGDWAAVVKGLETSKWAKDVGPGRSGRIIEMMRTGWYTAKTEELLRNEVV